MGCIYCHINKINGKRYIGQTMQEPPEKRWKKGSGYDIKEQSKFKNAIQKYSWENFEHIILVDYIYDRGELNRLETEWFELYKRLLGERNLYNTGRTGVAKNMSEECRKKISEANRGNKYCLGHRHTEESKRKMSISKLGNTVWRGRHHTEESKRKISESRIGNKYNLGHHHSIETKRKISESKFVKVVQMDLKGNIIKEYNSIKEARQETGVINISYVCRGLRKTAGGFKWKYGTDKI